MNMEINYHIHKNPSLEILIWILFPHLSSSAVQKPNMGTGHTSLVRLLNHTYSHLLGLLWISDQLVYEAATYITLDTRERPTPIPSCGFQPMVPAIKQLHTYSYSHQDQHLQVSWERPVYIFLISPMHATCSPHFMILDFIKIMWWTINIQKFFKKQQAHKQRC